MNVLHITKNSIAGKTKSSVSLKNATIFPDRIKSDLLIDSFIKNDLEDSVVSIIKWVDTNIAIKPFGFSDYINLGTRTPEQILQTKYTSLSFSCLDKAVVMGVLLDAIGLRAYIVTRRLLMKNGGSVGIHFTIEVTDGVSKLTIDPATKQTKIIRNWQNDVINSSLSFPFKGTTKVKSTSIFRKEIHMKMKNKKALAIAGFKGRFDYFLKCKVHFINFILFILSRMGEKVNSLIEVERKKYLSSL